MYPSSHASSFCRQSPSSEWNCSPGSGQVEGAVNILVMMLVAAQEPLAVKNEDGRRSEREPQRASTTPDGKENPEKAYGTSSTSITDGKDASLNMLDAEAAAMAGLAALTQSFVATTEFKSINNSSNGNGKKEAESGAHEAADALIALTSLSNVRNNRKRSRRGLDSNSSSNANSPKRRMISGPPSLRVEVPSPSKFKSRQSEVSTPKDEDVKGRAGDLSFASSAANTLLTSSNANREVCTS
eukprot:766457-Hanusia_phi.AAC.12